MPKISRYSYDIAVVAVRPDHTSGVSVLKVYRPCTRARVKLDLQTSNESVNLINTGFTTKFAFGVLLLHTTIAYISEFSTSTHITFDL